MYTTLKTINVKCIPGGYFCFQCMKITYKFSYMLSIFPVISSASRLSWWTETVWWRNTGSRLKPTGWVTLTCYTIVMGHLNLRPQRLWNTFELVLSPGTWVMNAILNLINVNSIIFLLISLDGYRYDDISKLISNLLLLFKTILGKSFISFEAKI